MTSTPAGTPEGHPSPADGGDPDEAEGTDAAADGHPSQAEGDVGDDNESD